MKKILSVLVVLIGTFQANAAALRTNMAGRLEDNINLNIIHTNVSNGRLEVLAADAKDRSKSWKCIISSEVAAKAGYQLGQLQTILMSPEDVKIFCEQAKDAYETNSIIVLWNSKKSL